MDVLVQRIQNVNHTIALITFALEMELVHYQVIHVLLMLIVILIYVWEESVVKDVPNIMLMEHSPKDVDVLMMWSVSQGFVLKILTNVSFLNVLEIILKDLTQMVVAVNISMTATQIIVIALDNARL